jgi:hypothetical protein
MNDERPVGSGISGALAFWIEPPVLKLDSESIAKYVI